MTRRPGRLERRIARLLEYARAAKKAAAVAGHQGRDDIGDNLGDHYYMGQAVAYQNLENLLTSMMKRKENDDDEDAAVQGQRPPDPAR
jgi:hypothetical protein